MGKGQISGQIIMYIVAAIIVVMIIGFGVSKMMNINSSVGKIKCVDFQKRFEETLKKNRAYGNVRSASIKVDCELSKICMIDVSERPNTYVDDLHPIIYDAWKDNVKKNVFMFDLDRKMIGSFYVAGMKVVDNDPNSDNPESPFACFDTGTGYINPKLYGKGKYLLVKKVS